MLSCTSAREGQVQTSPWLKANMVKPSSALSKNASSSLNTSAKKMFGDLPPSSSVTGMMFSDAYCMIRRPVVVSPVKAILAMRGLEASGLPASTPKPLTTLSTPGGSRSPISSISTMMRQRRLLGRLEHDAVAGGECRGQLPRRHQDREVPRNDLPDDAERLVEVIGDGRLVDLRQRAFLRADAAGEVAEVVDGERQVGGHRLADRLAVVDRLDGGQGRQVVLDAVGDLEQHGGAGGGSRLAPGVGGGVGGVERLVDVLGGRAGDLADELAADRRAVLEILALASARTHWPPMKLS